MELDVVRVLVVEESPALSARLLERLCGVPELTVVGVSRTVTEAVRDVVRACGYAIDAGTQDDVMGEGFAQMAIAPDYANSTFAVMAEYALVFGCEVSAVPDIGPRDMVASQLAACLAVMMGTAKTMRSVSISSGG